MKLFACLFGIILTLIVDCNQRGTQPPSSSSSTSKVENEIEKPTVIVISSDQLKIYLGTCETSKMKIFSKAVIGLS